MKRKTPAWQSSFWTPAQFAAVERKRAAGYRIDGPTFVALVIENQLRFRCPVCGVTHCHGFPENTDAPVHRAAHCTLTVLGERRSAISRLGYLLQPARPEKGSEAANLRRIEDGNTRLMGQWLAWVLPLLTRRGPAAGAPVTALDAEIARHEARVARLDARVASYEAELTRLLNVVPLTDTELEGMGMWLFGDTSREYAAAGMLESKLWIELTRMAMSVQARMPRARWDVH